ncbi:sn-1-specific diacylglycerol lipase ABHD11-like [Liolophura sinensis]|uniref:sn-1-specific diacylglycerol lipase ABHD11-like n=1 Tax=Liolophura sinensis TaxID=3198878 RepID=UPI0031591478
MRLFRETILRTLQVHAVRQYTTSPPVKPVKLAYATYQETNLEESDTPVLILHGLFGSKTNWQTIAKAFSNTGRKIITVDVRNHGESEHSPHMTYEHMSADVEQLMGDLHLKKTVLIGHSMGGKIAMTLALTKPDLVDRLIVVDVAPVISVQATVLQSYADTMREADIPVNNTLSRARHTVDKQLQKVVSDPNVRRFLLMNLVMDGEKVKWRLNIEGILSNYGRILGFPLFTNPFEGPTFFIGGGDSNHISEKEYPDITRLFPLAEFLHIEGAGHWVHSEKPVEFVRAVLQFLEKTKKSTS